MGLCPDEITYSNQTDVDVAAPQRNTLRRGPRMEICEGFPKTRPHF